MSDQPSVINYDQENKQLQLIIKDTRAATTIYWTGSESSRWDNANTLNWLTDGKEEKLDTIVNKMGQKRVVLQVHPYVDAFLKKGFYSLLCRWKFRYTRNLKVVAVQDLGCV